MKVLALYNSVVIFIKWAHLLVLIVVTES